MNNKAQQQRNIADQKEKMARDAAKLANLWRGLDDDIPQEEVYLSRHEIPAPTPLDQSKYNPNNIVDIVTFLTHPHFLGLNPYPWQILALKLFYAGSEGNSCLEFNDTKKEETDGCEKCVWNYVVKNEIDCADKIEKDENYLSFLNPMNSKCLGCSRCPVNTRKTRLTHELKMVSDQDQETVLQNILDKDTEDLFQSEMDLIEEVPDEAVKIQIAKKCLNKNKRSKFQDLVLVIGRRGTKLLGLNTPLLTTNGWKTMGSVKTGEFVFGPDGNPTRVTAKSEINYSEQAYEMHFSNGEKIIAGESHEWATLTKAERKNISRGKYSRSPKAQIFTTKQIAESLTCGTPRHILKKNSTERSEKLSFEFNHAIEITKPLIYNPKSLNIHPYLLGVYLGDGSKSSNTITGLDLEIFDYIQSNCSHNIDHSEYNQKSHYVRKHAVTGESFVSLLKKNNLYNNKHIPREYLENSIDNRMELLRGLNDSDGGAIKHNHTVRFVNTNKVLADNYYELVCGLGFKATIKEKDAKLYGRFISKCWVISYSVPENTKVFNLARKQQIIDSKITKNKSDRNRVFITACIPIENTGLQCIEVDNDSHLYLAGKSLIPTHNSFMTCTIALYELYKLLSMGHPQRKLKLPDFQEIHILNVAKNEGQAQDSIFTPMKNYAVASPYFQEYIGVDNALEMKFLTKADQAENKRRDAKGLAKLDGTIILMCGSSSAAGMVGKTCWVVILDELAAMAGDNPDSGLDKKLYSDLKPSLATFGKEGKIISLSNPKGPFGQLYHLYNSRLEDNTTLVLKIPTRLINANVDRIWLEEQRQQDAVEYNMQYEAEFGSNSADPFLSAEDVDYAFVNSQAITRFEAREPNVEYYCHLDPANRSDYYALVVVHAIPTGEVDIRGKSIKRFVVDHIHFWAPVQLKQPVQPEDVEKYIVELHKKFQFKQISFDQWHSSEMMAKLEAQGLPVVLKVFNKEYKDKIYMSLLEAFRTKRIEFYKMSAGKVRNKKDEIVDIGEIPEAKNQFTFLQKKWRNGRQIIEALSGYKDDICDATAAAIFECDHETKILTKYPRARVAYTGRRFR